MIGSLSVKARGQRFTLQHVDFSEPPFHLFAQLSSLIDDLSAHQMSIKFGFPKKKTITLDCPAPSLKSIGLSPNSVIIVEGLSPAEREQIAASMPAPPESPPKLAAKPQPSTHKKQERKAEQIPHESERGGVMIRRVIPADNSCLFNALSLAFSGTKQMAADFRELVAAEICKKPYRFEQEVLGKTPQEYGKWIRKSASWGGEPEMIILGDYLGIQIASVGVQHLHLNFFGPATSSQRVYVLHDGIHFDLITRNSHPEAPAESDTRIFSPGDILAEKGALAVAQELKALNKFTDVDKFQLICLVCRTPLKGQTEAVVHANETGHSNFSEIEK